MAAEQRSKHAQGGNGGARATLIIDASERDSDLLYASRFLAGDPFTYVEVEGRTFLILSDLELGRGRKEAKVDEVVSFSEIEKELEREGTMAPKLDDVAMRFLERRETRRIRVPARFPVRFADRMRARGFTIEVAEEPFLPARAIKTAAEISKIEAAQRVTEEVMLDAIEQIRRAAVASGGALELEGRPLTVESLKLRIRRQLLERGYHAADPIVAPGDQGCDPHDTGHGALRSGESIIIDIFPQHVESRYWGDMTRTVCKGKASAALDAMYRSVLRAHETALSAIKPGVTGAEVHRQVQESFAGDGYRTERKNGAWVGFFHGTGHGIGLDIHEAPRLSRNGPALAEGMVVTVEPGLYYPGIGGIRVEDIAVITASGCRNLNRAPKTLVV